MKKVLPVIILLLLNVSSSWAQSEFFSRHSPDYNKVVIYKVVSADTVVLDNLEKEHIRMIGLKAPEPPKPKKKELNEYGIIIKKVDPTISVEERAFNFVREMLQGKTVRLEFDEQLKDNKLNTVAYIFLPDGTMANDEILRHGYANLKIIPPNIKYADRLREAYQEARREKRGLQGQ